MDLGTLAVTRVSLAHAPAALFPETGIPPCPEPPELSIPPAGLSSMESTQDGQQRAGLLNRVGSQAL